MFNDKKLAAEESVAYIKDGMIVGLGSGSTVNLMLQKLGQRVGEGLDIKGIPSSKKTERLATELGIPLTDFSSVDRIDIAIDGADEVDSGLNLLKGGGGSLVREKVVDLTADKLVIVIDASKMVAELGDFPLPVEVVPFGWQVTAQNISDLGAVTSLRKKGRNVFVSDNGNYVLDCKFDKITEPKKLHEAIKQMVGVVETGLFLEMADEVVMAGNGRVMISVREDGGKRDESE